MLSERIKRNNYNKHYCNIYFWRTHAQQEIDLIEEYGGKFDAYEFKWSAGKKIKMPLAFKEAYLNTAFNIINKENLGDFLLKT